MWAWIDQRFQGKADRDDAVRYGWLPRRRRRWPNRTMQFAADLLW